MKDWRGNTQSVMATLNASSHALGERGEQDYYATPPVAVERLLAVETFSKPILEPACGGGHLSEALAKAGHEVLSTDLVDRGYGIGDTDFLKMDTDWPHDIITNPPFSISTEFALKALSMLRTGRKLALLLRIQFLESVKRQELFKKYPPKMVYVFIRNIRCAKNGDFEKATGNASTYAWFVWEKGYEGKPMISWI